MAALTRLSHHHHHLGYTNLMVDSMDSNSLSPTNINDIDDQNSCSSDDTVLSVGNENENQLDQLPKILPHQQQPDDDEEEDEELDRSNQENHCDDVDDDRGEETSTLCFKNIENHLNALSQIANSVQQQQHHHLHRISSSSSPSSSSMIMHRLSPSSSSTKSYGTDCPTSPINNNIFSFASAAAAAAAAAGSSATSSSSSSSLLLKSEHFFGDSFNHYFRSEQFRNAATVENISICNTSRINNALCSPTSVRSSDDTESIESPGSRLSNSFCQSTQLHKPIPQQPPPPSGHHSPSGGTENGTNLKFSIDNILKADFGRSKILDPITIRKSKPPPCKQRGSTITTSTSSASSGSSSTNLEKIGNLAMLHVSDRHSKEKTSATLVGIDKEKISGGGGGGPVDLSPKGLSGDEGTSGNKDDSGGGGGTSGNSKVSQPMLWPAWVYCTRYSDRPSSGPRTRRQKKPGGASSGSSGSGSSGGGSASKGQVPEEKRPRTAFSGAQLARLKHEFTENRYLTERRRQQLSAELGLNEAQIKIWFQNKRAKIKKASGQKNPLALQLMAQGLYNHSTIPLTKEEEELEKLQIQGKS